MILNCLYVKPSLIKQPNLVALVGVALPDLLILSRSLEEA